MKEAELAVVKVPVNIIEKEGLPLIKLEKENHRLRKKNFKLEQEDKQLEERLMEKDKIIDAIKFDRDNVIREKEIILEAFYICIKELEEIRKRFMILTSKKVQDFVEQAKESMK